MGRRILGERIILETTRGEEVFIELSEPRFTRDERSLRIAQYDCRTRGGGASWDGRTLVFGPRARTVRGSRILTLWRRTADARGVTMDHLAALLADHVGTYATVLDLAFLQKYNKCYRYSYFADAEYVTCKAVMRFRGETQPFELDVPVGCSFDLFALIACCAEGMTESSRKEPPKAASTPVGKALLEEATKRKAAEDKEKDSLFHPDTPGRPEEILSRMPAFDESWAIRPPESLRPADRVVILVGGRKPKPPRDLF